MERQNRSFYIIAFLFALVACDKNKVPAPETIAAINLKTGDIVVCGPAEKQFGTVAFETSCSDRVKKDFELALALLHSFEYDEAEKVFAEIIKDEPDCAMAYWGVAMSNFHPLWNPPTPGELEKGVKATAVAKSLSKTSERESQYIDAMADFYNEAKVTSHADRCANFEKAMEDIHKQYPEDKEAAIFYALALNGAADPRDKSFTKQKKAGSILENLYPNERNHPGIVHYVIHSFDSPELATLALAAAREYASIAPSSAHAQHMPSHIFTRLGLWEECINSNLVAASSAKCYAENSGIKGHWDEELHALDYLEYGYLQKGDNTLAKEQRDYLKTIKEVSPVNFKVAYAFAAMPSRYVLENKLWREAAALELYGENLDWEKFPWQKAIHHFARVLGSVHIGDIDAAKAELKTLTLLHDALAARKNAYEANQVQIQMKASEAWIRLKEGKNSEALALMTEAVEMEEATQKHPVTPGEVLPARELLGDMFMEMNDPRKALEAYEEDLKTHPNRFNGLYGAGLAAEKLGNDEKANTYYNQLLKVASSNSDRPELAAAKKYLKKKSTT